MSLDQITDKRIARPAPTHRVEIAHTGADGLQRVADARPDVILLDWRPGPEELLASGRWEGPVLVEGQEEFWNAIRAVRAFREGQGLTLEDAPERCGMDVATLSKLENGKQANPTRFTMLLQVGTACQRCGGRSPNGAPAGP